MSMIDSFTPGRIRLRSPLFKNSDTREAICQFLESLSALKTLQINERTGSCLLEYDSKALSTIKLLQSRPLFEELQNLEKEPQSQQRNQSIQNICQRLTEILQ